MIVAGAGCSAVTVCDASIVPAIRLVLNDNKTSATLIGKSTIIWTGPNVLTDSITVDLASGADPITVGFQAGAYSLIVRHAGYADWHGAVSVAGDRCKPQTTVVTASLTAD